MSATLAFLPNHRWQPQIDEQTARTRSELARITRVIARRYAREQFKERASEVQRISI
jgi:hypothetical protein